MQLRWAGAFDNSQGGMDTVEIVTSVRIEEIEAAEDEVGKMSEERVPPLLVYSRRR